MIEYLKQVQIATIDQMHADLDIPRDSLYKVLSRLAISDIAEEKVIKEGRKRCYTYRLAIFHEAKALLDYIGQSNTLSNRPNPDSDSDTERYWTKNTFSSDASGSIIDQTGTCDTLIDPQSDFPGKVVQYRGKNARNPYAAKVSPIGQLLDKPPPITGSTPDIASDSASECTIGQLLDKPQNSTPEPLGSINLQPGDRVEIIEGRFYGSRVIVQTVTPQGVFVKAPRWVVVQKYQPDQLRFIERGGSS
nr:MAG: hypothetical protein EDM05_32080 [Leptolyngbya sp. IPPAS B-1204]